MGQDRFIRSCTGLEVFEDQLGPLDATRRTEAGDLKISMEGSV